jgi:RNA polymerase sigma factor (sigma-70 family)
MADDLKLLREYLERDSEEAFRELAERHVGLVYSTAQRLLGNRELAEEVTQTVFMILAAKGRRLKGMTLAGWLHRTTRLSALQALRAECRRQRREERFAVLESNENDGWARIEPHLDEALNELGETDRSAVVLRFLEEKSLREVGETLGVSEDAARMRIQRAVTKLRSSFNKSGIVISSALVLSALSKASAAEAPVGLASSVIATLGIKGAGVAAATTPLAKEVLKVMALAKIKTASVMAVTVVALGVTTAVVTKNVAAEKKPAIREMWDRDNLKPEQRQQLAKMICLDNLKQLGWGAKRWADTNNGALPPNWMSLKGYITSPEFFTCVSDTNRTAVKEWPELRTSNITYPLLSPGVSEKRVNTIVATCPIHGHAVLSTGQAFQGDYIKQNGLKINGNKLE